MALKIKLIRIGRNKSQAFRIAVARERSKLTGRIIENLGFYNPNKKKPVISVNQELLSKWLKKGSTPTESVRKLLKL